MPKSKSVNPPKESHINPTLALPGFHGYPLKGADKVQAYKDGTVRPSPYGDISTDIFQGAILTKPILTNDQPWKHRKPMPYASDFNYPRKDLGPGVYPQPETSLQTGRASNPDTATYPNKYPYPVMTGLLEAQIAAYRQDALASEAARVKMPEEKPEEFRERMKSPAELFFEEIKKQHEAKKILRLIDAGYSEDEIREYLQTQRMRDIARHAENRDVYNEDMAAAALVHQTVEDMERQKSFYSRAGGATGFNAVGIGANSADAVHPITNPVSTGAVLRQNTSARGTGGSVAALQSAGGDARSSASLAARAEDMATILSRQERGYRHHFTDDVTTPRETRPVGEIDLTGETSDPTRPRRVIRVKPGTIGSSTYNVLEQLGLKKKEDE